MYAWKSIRQDGRSALAKTDRLYQLLRHYMQGKNILVIFLVLLAAAFGVGLIVINNKAQQERQQALAHITQLSNDVNVTQQKLSDQQQVNITLETNIAALKSDIADVSNKLSSTAATLASTTETLNKTQAEAKAAAAAAAAEMAKRDSRIKELEGQNDDLTKKMTDLNTALGGLEKQIADTERKLAASEGDREFLLKELKRLQVEKAELEKQFNDLAVLRDQVRHLKEELSISRRLDWIRRGIYSNQGQKGAESLTRPAVTTTQKTNDLKAEIKQNGPATIVSPTNAPPK
jgi:chromosome segregation ATPase